MRRDSARTGQQSPSQVVMDKVLEPTCDQLMGWIRGLARVGSIAIVLHFLFYFIQCSLHPMIEITLYDNHGQVTARYVKKKPTRDDPDPPVVYTGSTGGFFDRSDSGQDRTERYLDMDSAFPPLLGSLLLLMVVWSLPRYRGRQDLSFLETLDDMRDLPEVILLARSSDPELHAAASATLCRLLTRLPGTNAGLLSAEDQAGLCSLLRWERAREDLPLMRAILQALQQAGDSRAIPAVTRLAWRTPGDNDEERLQAAARQCLPILEARATEEQNARMLLRPSEQPPPALLRPSEPLPETLLRPVSVEGTEE